METAASLQSNEISRHGTTIFPLTAVMRCCNNVSYSVPEKLAHHQKFPRNLTSLLMSPPMVLQN